jgi:hypothetical protein
MTGCTHLGRECPHASLRLRIMAIGWIVGWVESYETHHLI